MATIPGSKAWVRNWEPRTKTVTSVLFIFGVISLHTPLLVLVALATVLVAVIFMGIPWPFLFKKLAILIPFLLLMAIPLIFGGGVPPATENIDFAVLLILKALTSMVVMIVMLTTQSVQQFLDGLAHLRIPPLVITVLFLAYRYAMRFMHELTYTLRALTSRLFTSGLRFGQMRVYGEITGGIIIKSIDLSENVYHAMASRGFEGKLPFGSPQNITSKDLLKSIFSLGIVGLIIVAEWTVT